MKFKATKLAAKFSTKCQVRCNCYQKTDQNERYEGYQNFRTGLTPSLRYGRRKKEKISTSRCDSTRSKKSGHWELPTQVWALFRFRRYDLQNPCCSLNALIRTSHKATITSKRGHKNDRQGYPLPFQLPIINRRYVGLYGSLLTPRGPSQSQFKYHYQLDLILVNGRCFFVVFFGRSRTIGHLGSREWRKGWGSR